MRERALQPPPHTLMYIIKIKLHSSCEIEDFVETHLCKYVRYSDRAYYGLCVLIKDIGRRLPLELQQCSAVIRVNRVMSVSLYILPGT